MKCRGKRYTTRNIPRSISFPRYISWYIAENRLPLGQCTVCLLLYKLIPTLCYSVMRSFCLFLLSLYIQWGTNCLKCKFKNIWKCCKATNKLNETKKICMSVPGLLADYRSQFPRLLLASFKVCTVLCRLLLNLWAKRYERGTSD